MVGGGITSDEAGFPFESRDDRVERTVLVVRRAEVAQADMGFADQPLLERREQARLADTGLAREQNDPPLAGFRLVPPPQSTAATFA